VIIIEEEEDPMEMVPE
jgi:hypothetical protein